MPDEMDSNLILGYEFSHGKLMVKNDDIHVNDIQLKKASSICNQKYCLTIPGNRFDLSDDIVTSLIRLTATCDYLLRKFISCRNILGMSESVILPNIGQFVLRRSDIRIVPSSFGGFNIDLDFFSTLLHNSEHHSTLMNLIENWILESSLISPSAISHWHSIEDQEYLRDFITKSDLGVCFVGNGSILPRAGGDDDRPLDSDKAIAFESPKSLQIEVNLPHKGKIIGMLIPKGVTVITGGGYHGKSTILKAISFGCYNVIPGDGREFVVTGVGGVTIRSEDGRYVSGVDITPFIDNLPSVTAVNPTNFSTTSASGSTSMAANVIEFMEHNPDLFLLDEDTCASNFMIRDSRMRSMIANEPITPFIYRVNSLYKQKNISSIVVIGGSGDWFDVQDTTIMMDNYICKDVSDRARSISRTFCTGRVQYNGRGLVHQLPWPESGESIDSKYHSEMNNKRRRSSSTGEKTGHRHRSDSIASANSDINHNNLSKRCLKYRKLISIDFQTLDDHMEYPNQFMKIISDDGGQNITFTFQEVAGSVMNGVTKISATDRVIKVDLAKIEQRIANKAGALGIAFAILFVVNTFTGESKDFTETVEDYSRRDNSSTCDSTPTPDTCSQLCRLLARFNRLSQFWVGIPRSDDLSIDNRSTLQQIITSIAFARGENLPNAVADELLIDLMLAVKIHYHCMASQSFIWPRTIEAAAAINRFRVANFSVI